MKRVSFRRSVLGRSAASDCTHSAAVKHSAVPHAYVRESAGYSSKTKVATVLRRRCFKHSARSHFTSHVIPWSTRPDVRRLTYALEYSLLSRGCINWMIRFLSCTYSTSIFFSHLQIAFRHEASIVVRHFLFSWSTGILVSRNKCCQLIAFPNWGC